MPLSPDALYYMYSCTKPMTAALGMRLVEEGRLDLDAPVSRYLPEFASLTVHDGEGARPAAREMTVRHLFTMSGGLNYNLGGEDIRSFLEKRGGDASTREIVGVFAERPLDFEPGTRYQYSLCHDVLAAVIAVAAGMPYSEYMRRTVFHPLGMTNSFFFDTEEVHARITPQYIVDGERAVPFEKSNPYHITPSYESGGAGLICSASDYAKFADTMACGGEAKNGYRLLKPETVDLLRTEQMTALGIDNFDCCAGAEYGYGLGVRTRVGITGERGSLGEFGWDGAAGSYVLMDPAEKLSIFFATHLRGWPAMILGVHTDIRDMVYEILDL